MQIVLSRRPANTNCSPDLAARFDAYFCRLGQGIAAKDLTRQRLSMAVRLDAMTDADLAALGTSRAEIPRLVFSDLFAI